MVPPSSRHIWIVSVIVAACLLSIGIIWFIRDHHSAPTATVASPTPTALSTPTPTLVVDPPAGTTAPAPTPTVSPTPNQNGLIPPIADFKPRITKKFFGTYVTPTNSPVSPERFTGYHTGIDVEYTDTTTDVPVYSIADGTVVTSEYASGYGGVMVIRYIITSKTLYAIFGHLRQSSMVKAGIVVKQGQQIAVLGTGYSAETDGERRHLHFGIATKNTITGYVSSLAALHATWMDPLSLYP